jgi:hypothetical protein
VLGPLLLTPSEIMESSNVLEAVQARSTQGKVSEPFASGTKACFDYRETLSGRHNGIEYVVAGMHVSYSGLCDAHTTDCPSPYATDVLVRQMLGMIDMTSKVLKLSYTLACESLLYGSGKLSQPPLYGCVAISGSQEKQWRVGLGRLQTMSSYVVVEDEGDGDGIFQLRYSRFSDVRVIFWKVPDGASLQVLRYSNIPDPAAEAESGIIGLCDSCRYCKTKRPSFTSGGLLNAATRFCAQESRNSSTVTFAACKYKGGDQAVVHTSDLQLSVGSRCLSSSTSSAGWSCVRALAHSSSSLDFVVDLVACSNNSSSTPSKSWVFENNDRYIRNLGIFCFVPIG